MGYMVYMDENGDAEGNYTLIAWKMVDSKYGLYPIGMFQIPVNRSNVPVIDTYNCLFEHTITFDLQNLDIFDSIKWINNGPPLDEPVCGFHGDKCKGTTCKYVIA